MRPILEFLEFIDQSWKKEVEESIEYHIFEDFLNKYGLRILFAWGVWSPGLHGFHTMPMFHSLRLAAPDRIDGSKNCLRINLMNAEWGSDVSGFDFDLEIRQDEDTNFEFEDIVDALRDELGYYIDIVEIKLPEKIEKMHYQITIDVIFEEKKKK